MKSRIYVSLIIILIGLILSAIIYYFIPLIGEPQRPEKEYKITLGGDIDSKIEKELYEFINEKIDKDYWSNNDKLPGKYYIGSNLDTNYFEDVYLDTEDNLLEKNNISYRFRYRRKNIDDIKNYLKNSVIPQRIEIQTKIYDKNFFDNKGYKTSLKNRYEIKNDYRLNFITKEILKRENLNLIMGFTKNSLINNKFTPIIALMNGIKNNNINLDYSKIKPSLYAILTRNRFHINKKTVFGYGDNGENVFLITIDHVTAYNDSNYKESIGKFSEIEIDFERNTLYLLFDAINGKYSNHSYTKKQLNDIWDSFEKDQLKIRNLIIEFLDKKGIKIEDGIKTKRQKIYEISNK